VQGFLSFLFFICAIAKGLASLIQATLNLRKFRAKSPEFREVSDSVIRCQLRRNLWLGIAELIALVIPWAGFQWANTSDFYYQWWGWLIWFGTGAIDDWTAVGLYALEQQHRRAIAR